MFKTMTHTPFPSLPPLSSPSALLPPPPPLSLQGRIQNSCLGGGAKDYECTSQARSPTSLTVGVQGPLNGPGRSQGFWCSLKCSLSLISILSNRIPLSNQLHRGTSPVKAYTFYGLVDWGKYWNTFQTDLSFTGEVAMVTNPPNPSFDVPEVIGQLQGAGFGWGTRN